jgi:hypothetical protein
MAVARGVSVLSKLGVVRIYVMPQTEFVFITLPWWRPQSGQSLSEYALLLGGLGVLGWALWSTLAQAGTDVVRVAVHMLYGGWADWMLNGGLTP